MCLCLLFIYGVNYSLLKAVIVRWPTHPLLGNSCRKQFDLFVGCCSVNTHLDVTGFVSWMG